MSVANIKIAQSLKDAILDLLSDSTAFNESHSQPRCKISSNPAAQSQSVASDVHSEFTCRAASRPSDFASPPATSLPDRFRAAAGYHPRGDAILPPLLQSCPLGPPPSQSPWRAALTIGSVTASTMSVSPPPPPHRSATAHHGCAPPSKWPTYEPSPHPTPSAAPQPVGWAAAGLIPPTGRRARGVKGPNEAEAGGPGPGRLRGRVPAATVRPAERTAQQMGADGGLAPW
jgi:hypothetical protein